MKLTKEQKRMEKEANHFAMRILMPRKLVQKWIDENGKVDLLDSSQIKRFASDFEVPESVATIRLSQLQ